MQEGQMTAERQYNYIFSRLVEGTSDIIGIVAYARYKSQKIEWIEDFKAKHERIPDDSDMVSFHLLVNTDQALAGFRLQAKEVLDNWTEQATTEAAQVIEDHYETEYQKKLADIRGAHQEAARAVLAQAKREGFWVGVRQNIWANLIVAGLVAMAILVLWSAKYGLADTVAGIFGYQPRQPQATTSGATPTGSPEGKAPQGGH